jgi:hypothetical protein
MKSTRAAATMVHAVFPLSMNGVSAVTVESALMGGKRGEGRFHGVTAVVTAV